MRTVSYKDKIMRNSSLKIDSSYSNSNITRTITRPRCVIAIDYVTISIRRDWIRSMIWNCVKTNRTCA